MLHDELRQHVRHNFVYNVLDAAFFGLGLGFASTVTVIPLFVNSLTSSTLLIGLIASLHVVGWQLPQILTARHVSRLRRYKPMVMFMTIHERWPYFGLAIVAALVPTMGAGGVLGLTTVLLACQALGGGLTATAWQTMIGKIMPRDRLGTFFGVQSAAASLMSSVGAVLAGIILQTLPSPWDFALCFFIAGIAMALSMALLGRTREPEHEPVITERMQHIGWSSLVEILRRDSNFRWFLFARMLAQAGWMAIGFYTVYATRTFNMTSETAGFMTGLLMLAQTIANPVLGVLGDRFGHRIVFVSGALMVAASTSLALFAPELGWFYLAFGLAGFANAVIWAVAISMTLEFGTGSEKPLYIGLVNTMIAPVTLFAPVIGGWLADSAGFQATFLLSIVCALLTAVVLQFIVYDPHRAPRKIQARMASAALER